MSDANTVSRRKIIHVDMDAFFASVEQRDNPEIKGKPVAVGGSARRGVVAAASYEARAFGVRSAMPSVTALRRCPALIFVKPRFEVYKAVSREIGAIFADYTPLIEPLSLDEAYLDVTDYAGKTMLATDIAREIRARIADQTGLTASAGVSYNKFLAKLASGHNKPNGLFVITPAMGAAFVEQLPVSRFHGVGPVTAAKMQRLGIETGKDLREKPLDFLLTHFREPGHYYHAISRGIDHRDVKPNRVRKSVGAETTFGEDLSEYGDMCAALRPLIAKVWGHCQTSGLSGRTLTLKVKYTDFTIVSRRSTRSTPFKGAEAVAELAFDLLAGLMPAAQPVRLLGVSLSNFQPNLATDEPAQMALTF